MHVPIIQIAWLAGLLEGEGYFGYNRGCPSIQLQMTDEDVVIKAAEIMGAKMGQVWRNRGPRKDGTPHKAVYSCRLHGTQAIALMQTLYPFMGVRRGARILEIVKLWKTSTYSPREKGVTKQATCHPDREMSAKGLCKSCYMARYHQMRRQQSAATAQQTS